MVRLGQDVVAQTKRQLVRMHGLTSGSARALLFELAGAGREQDDRLRGR
jgi:hypothetical protein